MVQAQTVSGLVTSDDGPLPGATIVVKGTTNGTTRRSDQIRFGKYYEGADTGKGSTVSPAYKNVMPIPLDAINAANGTLSQNEGY